MDHARWGDELALPGHVAKVFEMLICGCCCAGGMLTMYTCTTGNVLLYRLLLLLHSRRYVRPCTNGRMQHRC